MTDLNPLVIQAINIWRMCLLVSEVNKKSLNKLVLYKYSSEPSLQRIKLKYSPVVLCTDLETNTGVADVSHSTLCERGLLPFLTEQWEQW